ncbi:glycosyltransferase family 32 protein [Crepidotus variabilis]|uniref:Glycosyltransferase family 32 protein n=1 Tax=Crepidotus variabilis TaxID=179855 RepID=A0A9P6EKJ3_9AGAR|nr:glycosyltransferase family 32 protein [Crepidotus variabilis]
MSLPSHSSAVEEKLERQHRRNNSSAWTRPVSLSIPGVRTRRLRILVPNTGSFNSLRVSRMRRKRGPVFIFFACLAVLLTVVVVAKAIGRRGKWRDQWQQGPSGEPSTLVFKREELQKIWKWEVGSGHYPSTQPIPAKMSFKDKLYNPAIPPQPKRSKPARYIAPNTVDVVTEGTGTGPKRTYLDLQSQPPNVAYPPRPPPGSVADMDHVMRYCDFGQGKYVRDCLEMLRLGGGLDNGNRLRRDSSTVDHHYIYLEQPMNETAKRPQEDDEPEGQIPIYPKSFGNRIRKDDEDPYEGLYKKKGAEWESSLTLPATREHYVAQSLESPCDPENPRIYHMFWTGPFTDKPYMALLSFLYTQHTGLHLKDWPTDSKICRPQFWLWINPGPAATIPNPNALHDMYTQLKNNPWASPFLHTRFKDVIQFKLWNTTEQLDGIPEIKEEWRALRDNLFNSGGYIINVKKKATTTTTTEGEETVAETTTAADEDDIVNRLGSKSSSSYDRLSVILSDMARFVLTHRFGGIYLDADTILLRDWEELWGWTGAFAYRWSRLENYNTAVLKLNKNSALGTFLFRTAIKNGLDFHPMTVSRYTRDAYLQGLLLRLPDALFDAAWLNTENYQRDRPPQPYFTEFAHFFDTPAQNSAAPQALGIEGFFRGSYSYHFHNFWWKPFDSTRNFPDLGARFKKGEDLAHSLLRKERLKTIMAAKAKTKVGPTTADLMEDEYLNEDLLNTIGQDKVDLDWSAVLKRTFEAYIRGERPNMYGEWIEW